jgi:hypothetical protein
MVHQLSERELRMATNAAPMRPTFAVVGFTCPGCGEDWVPDPPRGHLTDADGRWWCEACADRDCVALAFHRCIQCEEVRPRAAFYYGKSGPIPADRLERHNYRFTRHAACYDCHTAAPRHRRGSRARS